MKSHQKHTFCDFSVFQYISIGMGDDGITMKWLLRSCPEETTHPWVDQNEGFCTGFG